MCELDGTAKQVRWAKSILAEFKAAIEGRSGTADDVAVFGCTDSGLLIDHRDVLTTGDSIRFCGLLAVKWIEWTGIDDYASFLLEKSRPPSQGGNTSAIHSHRVTIDGEIYYFKARGARRWIYANDSVRFAHYDADGRNLIFKGTVEVRETTGEMVVRGDRRAKKVQRTAEARMPVSRREASDKAED